MLNCLPHDAPECEAKDPYDAQAGYQHDFCDALAKGATITQLLGFEIWPSGNDGDLTVTVSTITTSFFTGRPAMAVNSVLSGGIPGVKYAVACRVFTSNGEALSRSIIVPVRPR